MKSVSSNKLMFGFSAIQSGAKAKSYDPELLALTSAGSFKVTPPVTRYLGLAAGDYLMFVSTVDDVQDAIINKAEVYVNFCNSLGLDVESPEAAYTFHKEYDVYAIAKGIQLYDSKGIALTTTEKLTRNDRMALVRQNFADVYQQAMESGVEAIVDALSREGITEDEQVEILANTIEGQTLPKFKGAKLANSSKMTGIGQILTCSDGSTWKALKAGMGETETTHIRRFAIDFDNAFKVTISNGYENVEVTALMLEEATDTKAIERGKGADDEVNDETAE